MPPMLGLIMTQGSIQQGIAKPVELQNRGRLGFYNALDRTHHHSHYQLPPGNLYASRMGIFKLARVSGVRGCVLDDCPACLLRPKELAFAVALIEKLPAPEFRGSRDCVVRTVPGHQEAGQVSECNRELRQPSCRQISPLV